MAQPRQQAPEYRVSVQSPDSAYGPQLLEPQHGPYHVTASRSRRSHYSVPSPNSSMISSNPVPLTRPFDSTSFSQPGYLPSELPVDPRLDELSFGSQSGRASPSFNPNVEPWGPHNLRNNFVQLLSPHVAYNRYPNGPGSAGKHSAPRSDSGYQSQSAISNEYGVYNADSQQTVMSRVNSQHRNSVTLVQAPLQPPIPLDQRSQVSSRDEPHDKSLVCSICGNSCKCKSDYKCVTILPCT